MVVIVAKPICWNCFSKGEVSHEAGRCISLSSQEIGFVPPVTHRFLTQNGVHWWPNEVRQLTPLVVHDVYRSGEGMGFQPKLARQSDGLETGFSPTSPIP